MFINYCEKNIYKQKQHVFALNTFSNVTAYDNTRRKRITIVQKYDHLILCNSLVKLSNSTKIPSVCGIRRKKYAIKSVFDPKPLFSGYSC